MKRTILLVGLLLALVLVACGGAEERADEAEDNGREVSIAARDIEYGTERLEVMAGEPVVVTLANEGALEHDFSIVHIPLSGEAMSAEEEEMEGHDMTMDEDELDVHVSAGPNDTATVTFTPSEPGEYEYFCTVAGHKESGMVGTLVVAAP
jgi:uncharacterized cupredoxin-like copper-binding protein